MIRIRGFSRYFLCPRKMEVFRLQGENYVPLSPTRRRRTQKTYVLHEDGVEYVVSLFSILRDNWEVILDFMGMRNGGATEVRPDHDGHVEKSEC